MPFRLETRVGARNHVLDGGPGLPNRRGNFEALEEAAYCKLYGFSAVTCAKTAEPIEIPFGLWTRVGPRKHVLGGAHIGATWRIRSNRPCAAAMRPFVKLL